MGGLIFSFCYKNLIICEWMNIVPSFVCKHSNLMALNFVIHSFVEGLQYIIHI